MPLIEWRVSCEWCGAKPGEPCVSLQGEPYDTMVHRPRAKLFDEVEAKRLVASRPVLLPPKYRYVKKSSGIRNSGGTQ